MNTPGGEEDTDGSALPEEEPVTQSQPCTEQICILGYN